MARGLYFRRINEIAKGRDSYKNVLKYTNIQIDQNNIIPALRSYCESLRIKMYINRKGTRHIAYLNRQVTINNEINKSRHGISNATNNLQQI